METDVLIVGGGLAGCCTAYFLAREGVSVTVIERADLGSQASGANAGSLHAQIPHVTFVEQGEDWARGFAPAIPLMVRSIGLWKQLERELAVDLEIATPGGLLVAATGAQMRDIERKAAIERAHGLEVEILSAGDLRRLAPYVADGMAGAAFCPVEGKVNSLKVTPALAAAARACGARFLVDTELSALEAGGNGFLALTSGGPIRARRVVNCGGAAAGRIAAMLGLTLPIEGFPIQVTVTEPVEPLVGHLVYFAGDMLTLKQTRAGALLIGGGWPSTLTSPHGRPTVNPVSLIANLKVAKTVVPRVASARVLRTWPAIVNGTADWRPVIGEVPRHPGFFLNFFPWMGFTGGPVAARITADLVLGRSPEVDCAAFRPRA